MQDSFTRHCPNCSQLTSSAGCVEARLKAAKFFGMMVARDGVEPPTPAFSVR